jgi:hypothetical protein
VTSYRASTTGPSKVACTTATTTCALHGLTNGTNYSVVVFAFNAAGRSAPSSPVVGAPSALPGAPTDVTATASSTRATVSWTPPLNDGGSPIQTYTVTSSPDGATCTYAVTEPENDSCTVTGLTNGTQYVFTVVAYNAAGPSAASDASNAVTPVTVPDAPGGVQASSVTTNSATISWSVPYNGGSPITQYNVSGGTGCTTSSTSCNMAGLGPSTNYTVCVSATNGVGTGASGCTSFRTADLPQPSISASRGGVYGCSVCHSLDIAVHNFPTGTYTYYCHDNSGSSGSDVIFYSNTVTVSDPNQSSWSGVFCFDSAPYVAYLVMNNVRSNAVQF